MRNFNSHFQKHPLIQTRIQFSNILAYGVLKISNMLQDLELIIRIYIYRTYLYLHYVFIFIELSYTIVTQRLISTNTTGETVFDPSYILQDISFNSFIYFTYCVRLPAIGQGIYIYFFSWQQWAEVYLFFLVGSNVPIALLLVFLGLAVMGR